MRNECIYVGIFNMMGNGEHQNQTRHFLRYPVFREKKHLQQNLMEANWQTNPNRILRRKAVHNKQSSLRVHTGYIKYSTSITENYCKPL